jgi:hypothetical protein
MSALSNPSSQPARRKDPGRSPRAELMRVMTMV